MTKNPSLIPIDKLSPHPKNPRVLEREDVISEIERQLRAAGFDACHAITVRPANSGYEIISGHNRVKAAQRAGLSELPAWIREMDDETAFFQLILSNAQGELSPLERGMHALAATEKGSKTGKSVAAYAERIGKTAQAIHVEIAAARVASSLKSIGDCSGLVNKCTHLSEIHAAPSHCWSALADRLIQHDWSVEETKREVATIRQLKPPRGYEEIFPLEKLQLLQAQGEDVGEMTGNLVRIIERAYSDLRDGQFESELYQQQFTRWLAEYGPWDGAAIAAEGQRLYAQQRQARQESDRKANKLKRPVTLAEWKALKASEQSALLAVRNANAKMNKQKNDDIEWARWSWNPVTGCLHNCPYCYARDIAESIYPQKFEPSFVPEALAAPLNAAPPKEVAADLAWKNIFTCSMADLFGSWVPREWIEGVLEIARKANQWNFLFLTKFPQRFKEFQFPNNAWLGTTVDLQARAANAERALRSAEATVKWLSIEPLIEPITIDFSLFQWIVIGGASESSQTPEWKPPRKWVTELTARAQAQGCAVYHKTNLNLERLREYPGRREEESRRAPDAFHYLKETSPRSSVTVLTA